MSLTDTPFPRQLKRDGLKTRPKPRFATSRVVSALILREMSTTYGRSPGGYVWAVLEPVAGIALLTLVFSFLFRAPPLGMNFPLFYASGLVPLLMYMDISAKLATSIRFSRPLLMYPRVTLADAFLARAILASITQILVAAIVFMGILLAFESRTTVDLPKLVRGLSMAIELAIGVGILNCYLFQRFPVWERVWAILNRPMFLISCVLFLFDDVPEPFKSWLWFNPIVHIVGQVRSGIYPYYDAFYVAPFYVSGFALVTACVGLLLLRRHYLYLLNN